MAIFITDVMVLLSVVYTDFPLTGPYQKLKKKNRERVYILEATRRGEGKGGNEGGKGRGTLSSLHNTFPLLQTLLVQRKLEGSGQTEVSERGGVFNIRSVIVRQGNKK